LSNTAPAGDITADINGTAATVQYAGLAPYLVGLYQLNVTIPTTATAGDNYLEIFGPDSDNLQALIPVGSGVTGAAVSKAARRPAPRLRPRSKPRPQACFFNNCKTADAASLRVSPNHPAAEPAQ
jgi:hypothetical protein